MTGATWKIIPEDDHHLRIEADGPLVSLSAQDVERFIAELSAFREKMHPEVPKQAPAGQYQAIVDPIYTAGAGPVGMTLALRHAGIGWLAFHFPAAEAQKLAGAFRQSGPGTPNPPAPKRPLH